MLGVTHQTPVMKILDYVLKHESNVHIQPITKRTAYTNSAHGVMANVLTQMAIARFLLTVPLEKIGTRVKKTIASGRKTATASMKVSVDALLGWRKMRTQEYAPMQWSLAKLQLILKSHVLVWAAHDVIANVATPKLN